MLREILFSVANKNGVIAGAAVVSPVWLERLEMVSQVATLILPLLGAGWLIMQMGYATYNQLNKKDKE